MVQAALEGALSALANIAELSSDAQESARKDGLLEILIGSLQQATNGTAHLLVTQWPAATLPAVAPHCSHSRAPSKKTQHDVSC